MYFQRITLLLVSFIFSFSLCGQIYVDHSATGVNDGSSWADAFVDLTQAINSTTVGGEVWVAQGVYFPGGDSPSRDASFSLPHDMKLFGGFSGSETALDQRDFVQNVTQLSGDHAGNDVADDFISNRADNSRHVMFLSEVVTGESIIDGFHFVHGSSDDATSSGNERRGGGILTYGTPSIKNCTFSQNYGWFGGGLYPRGATTETIYVQNCNFINNRAGSGGGMYVNQSMVHVSDCLFEGNTAVENGGGMFNRTGTGSVVDNCIFNQNIVESNEGSGGGGIYMSFSAASVSNCVFDRNVALARRGGGMYIRESNTQVNACMFDGNSAGSLTGAGIHIFSDSIPVVVRISDTEFSGGFANWGGAMSAYNEPLTVEVVNCDINNNESIVHGGGIYVGFGANVIVSDSEIQRNVAGNGAAFACQNDLSKMVVMDSDLSFNEALSRGGVAHTFTSDSVFVGNPKLEIHRSSFNFNTCAEQGGVLNLTNTDLLIVNSVFTNNKNFSTEGAGGVMSLNTTDTKVNQYELINNTFYLNEGAIGSVIGNWTDTTGVSNLFLQNNIFSRSSIAAYAIEDGTPSIQSRGGNISDDGSLMMLDGVNDTHNEDPQLAGPTSGEFNLGDGSPAINTGVNDGAPTLDITKAFRDDQVDKGAYEYGVSAAVEDLSVSVKQLSLYPNPAKESVQYILDNNWTGPVLMTVKNIMGQVIHQEKTRKTEEIVEGRIDVSDYETGAFMVNFQNATHSVTRTFVKN